MATALGGCSTKPRNFAASVSTPVPDRMAFEQDEVSFSRKRLEPELRRFCETGGV